MDFDYLKDYMQIYIIGHKRPDVDSIFSSYVLSNIFKKMGIKADYAILDEDYDLLLDEKRVIEDYFDLKPVIIKKADIANYSYFLVDHNQPFNSIDHGNVVGCIDHHLGTNPHKKNYHIGSFASTGAYIYHIFKHVYDFSDYEKKLIALTIIMDTKFLMTFRYKDHDKAIYEELNAGFNLPELTAKYFTTTDFSLDLETNYQDRFKAYEMNNQIINTTYINALTKHHEYLDKYVEYLQDKVGNWVLIWYEYDTLKTYVHLKVNDEYHCINYDFIASRANDIVLDVKKLLF